MTLSNEPGYYEAGAFGIRCENVLLVQKVSDCKLIVLALGQMLSGLQAETEKSFGNRSYLRFECLTLVSC